MKGLSKTRVMSALHCPKKAWLETHRKELAQYSAQTLAAFDNGHVVGTLAKGVYGPGTEISWAGGSFAGALQQTRSLMSGLLREPLFEATLEHDGVLVREDVTLPVGDSWRMVEVKAATSLKDEYPPDCAIQAWVHLGAGHPLESIALGHVNNEWTWDGSDDYTGFLIEKDLTAEVMELLPSVPHWVAAAKEVVNGPLPDTPVGQHCYKPYVCPFIAHCWPQDVRYPVSGLGGSREKLGQWIAAGYRDLREVPLDLLTDKQLRIALATRREQREIDPAAGEFVRDLAYPRHYLDFETVAPAIPVWPGTRPYETLPFQYSCHVEHASGELGHSEFLEMSADPPMRALAEQLLADLGAEGPVLMYTDYERRVLRGLGARFPDLAGAFDAIDRRLVDLAPVTRQHYYHPDMLGSWSIKDVLPTIAPHLAYDRIAGVKEGTEASRTYLAAIQPDAGQEQREATRRELLAYCRHDTLAMVELVRFFSNH